MRILIQTLGSAGDVHPFISHAGVGTCAQGLVAGLPHLARPLAFDQLDNASRLVDLGVGACLPACHPLHRRARHTHARAILESQAVEAACREARQRMSQEDDVLEETCRLIEDTRFSG